MTGNTLKQKYFRSGHLSNPLSFSVDKFIK